MQSDIYRKNDKKENTLRQLSKGKYQEGNKQKNIQGNQYLEKDMKVCKQNHINRHINIKENTQQTIHESTNDVQYKQ